MTVKLDRKKKCFLITNSSTFRSAGKSISRILSYPVGAARSTVVQQRKWLEKYWSGQVGRCGERAWLPSEARLGVEGVHRLHSASNRREIKSEGETEEPSAARALNPVPLSCPPLLLPSSVATRT